MREPLPKPNCQCPMHDSPAKPTLRQPRKWGPRLLLTAALVALISALCTWLDIPLPPPSATCAIAITIGAISGIWFPYFDAIGPDTPTNNTNPPDSTDKGHPMPREPKRRPPRSDPHGTYEIPTVPGYVTMDDRPIQATDQRPTQSAMPPAAPASEH